ncbi:MAG: type II toxin-antitoxin system RelE/ParE family toxin [Proteobacteria bacterium]|nr:type II toxin-antitoxin system RelE/ParE family toxin [Pseudomonadota bacterium]
MIRSFASKETERVWREEWSRRLPADVQRIGLRKLQIINAVSDVSELRVPPGNQLEALKGDRKGQWSIRINGQWRICFRWVNGHAEDVEICDYH